MPIYIVRGAVKTRQHCRLSICENWLSWTNTVSDNTDKYSIRTKDPNNHSDTETGTLSITMPIHIVVDDFYNILDFYRTQD